MILCNSEIHVKNKLFYNLFYERLFMNDCIFCKIIRNEMPSEKVYEDDETVAFKDIYPKARVHILVVPKVHIPSVAHLKEGEESIVGHLVATANKVAKNYNLEGYKLLMNVGEKGGQVIFHIHLHLLGD